MGNKHSDSAAEQFIIEFNRKKHENGAAISIPESVITSQRRVVFVSFIGLYSTWSECPASVLYPAIFILPLKRRWIFEPTKYQQEFQTSIVGQLFELGFFQKDESSWIQFTQMLKWKDSQNLVFWMLDADRCSYPLAHNYSFVAPVWHLFNERLTKLYDPVTHAPYQPLQLDENWWKLTYNQTTPAHRSRFGASVASIVVELEFVTLKYQTIKEIVHQSNPHSFHLVQSCYDLTIAEFETDRGGFYKDETLNASAGSIANCNVNQGEWMISADYDTEST
mmetsp:Transcript_17541/g.28003  ORF Transcript_17541/g.28003 Transcript_17541/m.28003 type:complete len:279 (+) Transcript_17541:41-877(+)